ncbi:MAG TPA: exodeoxyribonuclease VII small subunit [Gemmataceae bacterium]
MTSPDEPSFEQALAELEQILRSLEDGTATLEESLARYERGVTLLKQCYGKLRDAEQRIVRLTGGEADADPAAEPFDPAAAVEPGKPARRRGGGNGGTLPFSG